MTKKSILETLKGNTQTTPPIWFMRQAGRYLPEYREIRSKTNSFMEFCYTPKKACEVTLQPITRFGMDAAIIFSDILVIPHALGRDVWFVKGEGPKLNPITTEAEIHALQHDPSVLAPVYEALRLTKASLPIETALIGFAGAPWTLATYMIEGGSSRDFEKTKTFAYRYPKAFKCLLEILSDAVSEHLIAQVDAGAEVLQIFDSWAGVIPDVLFESACLVPFSRIVAKVKAVHPDTPIIGFPRGVGAKYANFAAVTGVDALSIDQMTSWEWACENISVPIQGNLDPILLATDKEKAVAESKRIVALAKNHPFVFNLGHGIVPHAPIENVEAVIAAIRGR